MVKIALASGHHNTSGGNQVEHALVGPITVAYARHLRALGADVRVVQAQDGLADYPGSLDAVARQVVAWASAGWVADLFLETHTEGGAGRRGCFGIYPDWPLSTGGSDTDADARDRFIPAIVAAIAKATGIPVRGNGLMGERATGVGSTGSRLGVFRATVDLRITTTRLLIEHGSHDMPEDLAILQRPGAAETIGKAAAGAIMQVAGGGAGGGSDPDVIIIPQTGKQLGHGFLAWWRANNGQAVLGWPITNEYTEDDGATSQLFERGKLTYRPATGVRHASLGIEYQAMVGVAEGLRKRLLAVRKLTDGIT